MLTISSTELALVYKDVFLISSHVQNPVSILETLHHVWVYFQHGRN